MPTPSAPRDKKLLIAGVALAGASVIAINPVAPAVPALQDRAVELSAWVDPFATWGETITGTVGNLGTQSNAIVTEGLPAAWEVITTGSLYSEIAQAVFNPAPGLEQFFNNLPTYLETLNAGFAESNAGLTEHFAELPVALEEAWDFVLQGQFTQAFANVVSWGLFGLGEAGWPLYPSFEIPGQIARDFGAPTIGAVLDALFVGDTTTTGYAYSLLGPPITAIYQLTDILNVVSGSLYEGDWVTAVSEVINAPAKVLNAFFNGYQASISPEWETFPGIFTEGGPIDAFFVQLPKTIAAAIAALSEESEGDGAETADALLAKVSSTDLASDADLVALNVSAETAEDTATAVDGEAESTEPSPAGEDVTPVADDVATEDETVTEEETATDEETVTDEDTVAEEEADDTETADETVADEDTDSAADDADSSDGEADSDSDTAKDSDAEEPKRGSDSSKSDSGKSDSDKSDSDKSDSGKSDSSSSGSDD
ncbi:MAG: hypothetical protein WBB00_24160 [Mycobacterium sp.]